jgi:hypothetical protein
MAKAVVPMARFQEKYGPLEGPAITARISEMAEQFLQEQAAKPAKEALAR